jgi:hypothetical protein
MAGWKRSNFFLSAAEFSCSAVEKRKLANGGKDLSAMDWAVCRPPRQTVLFLRRQKWKEPEGDAVSRAKPLWRFISAKVVEWKSKTIGRFFCIVTVEGRMKKDSRTFSQTTPIANLKSTETK